MFGNDGIATANDDSICIGSDLDRTPGCLGHYRVAVTIEADQAGAGDRVLGLVEPVERRQHRLQRWPLSGQRFGNRHIAILGMRLHRCPAEALGLQPPVQLLEAGEPQPGLEEPPPDRLDLVLYLPLLPACRWRTSGRLDHVMVGHDQEAAVEHPVLAGEHRGHRRLHIIVDAAQWHAAEEHERPRVRIEHHLLCLARIAAHIHCPRPAQPHMGSLHPHGRASDLDVFVAPVELVRLAGLEQQRDERRGTVAGILAPRRRPARCIAAHSIVGSFKPLALEQIVDPRHPQAIPARAAFVLRQQRVEALLKRPDPR